MFLFFEKKFAVGMVAVFTVNLLLKPGWMLSTDFGMIVFQLSNNYLFRYPELVLFAWIGLLGGLIGASFVAANIKINKLRRSTMKNSKLFSFIEVIKEGEFSGKTNNFFW